jgi:metal-responsive CopG/Arc/MetJ family transcriptional regulator
MKRTRKRASRKTAEAIQRVNVDFTAAMLKELDGAASELNISRQAVIKTLVRQGLDRHYFAKTRGRKLAREWRSAGRRRCG